MNQIDTYFDQLIALAVDFGPKLLLAIVFLIVGLRIIKAFIRFFKNALNKRDVDPSLSPFVSSILDALLKIMLVISVISMVGVNTTSFIAVLGAAGLAVGLALQGSLSNFASGVLILILKPYRVGDVIETAGQTALVHEIQIFHTILKSFDNKHVIVPNSQVYSGVITNYSKEEFRRVDMQFGAGYDDDLRKVKSILEKLVSEDDRVLKEEGREPFVRMTEMADSSINFTVRVWAKAADYWAIYFDMMEKVKLAFDQEGISIPFPQVDAHIYQEKLLHDNRNN
jgi:small conductance mechanosensitive channel